MFPKYVWADDVLTADECSLIIDSGIRNMKRANTENNDPGNYRKGSIGWFLKGENPETDAVLEKVIYVFGGIVHDYFCGVQLNKIEPIQFTHYEKGDHFGWHYDAFGGSDMPVRLFSASLELSDPESYEGGGLEFHETIENPIPHRNQGRLIVFPSLLLHRARKVTAGRRCSLVLWGGV